ncbi:unnamed protein product [Porites evermanni]|uniref:Protein kinase domain-containing protein n=1 Tax=Porites evermanni TaxID=104178 RepID=A0ABN8LJP6_9CNID|nr:unnamed protein product [Porites evermanni]
MKAGPVIGPFVFSFYMLQSVFQYFKGKCSGKREVATGEIKIPELTEKAPVKIEQESQKCPVKRRRSEEQLDKIKTKKQRKSISLYKLKAIKMIGEGAFGKVRLCEDRRTKRPYAVKQIIEPDPSSVEEKVLSLASSSPFITRLCEEVENPYPGHFIILEFVEGGDLFTELDENGWLSENRTRFYTAEIIAGLQFLHQKGVIHRDLKPENILLTKKGDIKISDFGLSAIIDPVKQEKINNAEIIGTPRYMAPEIILQDPYDACVDWWALGVMVFTMLTGMMPFDAESEDELFDLIVYHYPQKPDKVTMSELSTDATELFLHLLEKYPQDRLGYKGGDYPCIRDHTFFHGFDWNRLEALELDRPP